MSRFARSPFVFHAADIGIGGDAPPAPQNPAVAPETQPQGVPQADGYQSGFTMMSGQQPAPIEPKKFYEEVPEPTATPASPPVPVPAPPVPPPPSAAPAQPAADTTMAEILAAAQSSDPQLAELAKQALLQRWGVQPPAPATPAAPPPPAEPNWGEIEKSLVASEVEAYKRRFVVTEKVINDQGGIEYKETFRDGYDPNDPRTQDVISIKVERALEKRQQAWREEQAAKANEARQRADQERAQQESIQSQRQVEKTVMALANRYVNEGIPLAGTTMTTKDLIANNPLAKELHIAEVDRTLLAIKTNPDYAKQFGAQYETWLQAKGRDDSAASLANYLNQHVWARISPHLQSPATSATPPAGQGTQVPSRQVPSMPGMAPTPTAPPGMELKSNTPGTPGKADIQTRIAPATFPNNPDGVKQMVASRLAALGGHM